MHKFYGFKVRFTWGSRTESYLINSCERWVRCVSDLNDEHQLKHAWHEVKRSYVEIFVNGEWKAYNDVD